MATIIKVLDVTCTLDYYEEHKWTCEGEGDPEMAEHILNANLSFFDPGGEDPNPPYTHAQKMAEMLAGEVVEFEELPFDPDVIY